MKLVLTRGEAVRQPALQYLELRMWGFVQADSIRNLRPVFAKFFTVEKYRDRLCFRTRRLNRPDFSGSRLGHGAFYIGLEPDDAMVRFPCRLVPSAAHRFREIGRSNAQLSRAVFREGEHLTKSRQL